MKLYKNRVSLLVLLPCIFISVNAYSQDDKDEDKQDNVPADQLAPVPAPLEEIFYQGSLQGGGGIIYPITNKALATTLQGVYYLHFSPQYVFRQHYFVGLEMENSQLGISSETPVPYNTNMLTYSAGLKFGRYSYMQHDFLTSVSLSLGYSYILFNNVPNPAPKGGFYQFAPFITPSFFAGYRVNDEFRIGLELTTVFTLYQFDPAYLGLDKFTVYNPSDSRGITTCFIWGFGVYEAFAEKKSK